MNLSLLPVTELAHSRYRTGISLHSHTLHSKESLSFITHAARHSTPLDLVLRHGAARYKAIHGKDLDLSRGWWTPPLAPLDALRVESVQMESAGLHPLVSLTDHDDIEAGMSLQAMDASRSVPISTEWTVPFGVTYFHLGVHNMLPQHARMLMRRLEEFTASPDPAHLGMVLEDLHSHPATLIVFNHPLWAPRGVHADLHRQEAEEFLRLHGEFVHALELNGLRPWAENQAVIQFAERWKQPLISGGDRHALEPNAVINVSNAGTFAEFVQEVRRDGHSNVVALEHFHEGYGARVFHNMLDVFRTYDNHGRGWAEWGDRVFFKSDTGEVKSLRQYWGDNPPPAVGLFANFMRFAGQRPVRRFLRSAAQMGARV